MDIVITFAENGYIIKQRKKGYDWTNHWVAENTESLRNIITDRTKEYWNERKEDK